MKMLKNIHLIIPMSGIGKRFVDAGYLEPKPLIIVDGKPIIEHVIGLFPKINKITFICNSNHLKNTNMSNVLRDIAPNSKIIEIEDGLKKGPVYAVYKIFEYIDDNEEVIFSYCDYGTIWDFDKFIIDKEKYDGFIPCYRGFHPHMLGSDNYAFCNVKNGLVKEIKEKEPFTKNKMNEYASNGTYYFKSGKLVKKYFKKLIDLDVNINGEYYISLVYNLLIKDNLKIGVFEIKKMLQWGTPYDLEIYKGWSNFFSKKQVEPKNNPLNTSLILPMAGRGSRFTKDGYTIPKPLIKIDNEPMVVKAVNCLPKCDKNIFICLDEHIKEHKINDILIENYNNTEVWGINEITEGQACTCEIGINKSKLNLNDPILISACDNGVHYDVEKYDELINDKSIDIIVWSFRNNQTSKVNPNSYAWLEVDSNDIVKHVSCKKFTHGDPLKKHAIVGTMFFRKAKYFIDGLKKNIKENKRINNEFYVDDVLNQNIKNGLIIKVFEVENYICWGTPNDLLTYNYWKEHFVK